MPIETEQSVPTSVLVPTSEKSVAEPKSVAEGSQAKLLLLKSVRVKR